MCAFLIHTVCEHRVYLIPNSLCVCAFRIHTVCVQRVYLNSHSLCMCEAITLCRMIRESLPQSSLTLYVCIPHSYCMYRPCKCRAITLFRRIRQSLWPYIQNISIRMAYCNETLSQKHSPTHPSPPPRVLTPTLTFSIAPPHSRL